MKNTKELEDRLSQPSEALIEDLRQIDGDILLLGVGGKMGPSLAKLAQRAVREGGLKNKIIGVSRFSNAGARKELEDLGIETIAGDLLAESFLSSLPDCPNVIFMAGQKFGTSGNEPYTWAMNAYLPGRVGERYRNARIVVFSSGNVYPFVPVDGPGAGESTPPGPVGEYAQSCLGRERMFEYGSLKYGTPILLYRLNYALDLRYGVLNDIARAVWNREPVDLRMGYFNCIWQGDANSYALRSLRLCASPSAILNVTGPEKASVREVALQLAERMKRDVQVVGEPAETALLNDAAHCHELFGPPEVTLPTLIDWTAEWVMRGGEDLGKPTHFQERTGKF
jgi:nucleoside-diphosphate-sugar epimerase